MTIFAKLLVFLCLILGIGAAVFSTATYTQRPPWFKPAPEGGVDKGNLVYSFPQLAADIDLLGKQAAAAGAAWGAELKTVGEAEKTRAARYLKMYGTIPPAPGKADGFRPTGARGYLDFAHTGSKGDGTGPGFYQLKEDPATRLLNLDDPSAPALNGPFNQPLEGADNLLVEYFKDSEKLEKEILPAITAARKKAGDLGVEIGTTELRVFKQQLISENLRNEAAYLGSLEVNVTEERQTVTRRRAQLRRELARFGVPGQ